MPWIPFGFALAASLALIPLARRLSFRLGMVARPRDDRWHKKPTATLGGIGIFLGVWLALLVTDLAGDDVRWELLAGSAVIFVLGFYDDLKRLSPQAKLVGQFLGATIIVYLGYTTAFFTPRLPVNVIAQILNILVTYVWLVGITNAINLLDNMDGLAGGISLITALILSFFFWDTRSEGLLSIALALAGSTLGFLIFNFPPASIFMGDSGSLFLGFTLASLAIARQPQASNVFAVLAVPTLLFMLPILDTTLVTFTRILRGQSPAQGGRDHTSHRLIAFGLTERQAVMALYAVALASGVLAAGLESLQYWYSLILVPLLLIGLALLTAYLGGLKVVAAPPAGYPGKAITRVILELTYKRRLLEVFLDFFLIGVTLYLAILVRYGFQMNADRLNLFLQSLPLALGGVYLSFFLFGVYRGVWRYVGVGDLIRYLGAAAGSVFLLWIGINLSLPAGRYNLVVFLLFGVFLFIGLAATRSSFRILDLLSSRRTKTEEERVLIYGAGDAGEMALRWILMNPHMALRPVGFLDDDPYLVGRQIHGIDVLGGKDLLETILEQKQVQGVILAGLISADLSTPNREGRNQNADLEAIQACCRRSGVWVRTLRLEFEVLE